MVARCNSRATFPDFVTRVRPMSRRLRGAPTPRLP
jgi:hypothetical protein